MPKIDVDAVSVRKGAAYPPPFDAPCAARVRRRLTEDSGLTAFGVNRLTLPPGAWSSQRHWHSREDEFVYVLSGEVVLITDGGEEVLRAGDCAAFKAGEPNGHHLVNRADGEAVVLEVGGDDPNHDRVVYSDIDLVAEPGEATYSHRDGAAYPLE